MEAVTLHPLLLVAARQPEPARAIVHCLVERGVEAGDLRDVRLQSRTSANGREIMRLVQRSERLQFAKPLHDAIVDTNRRFELGAAMDDAVADRLQLAMTLLRKPGEKLMQKILVSEPGAAFIEVAGHNYLAAGLARDQMRSNPDLLDFTAQDIPQPRGRRTPSGKLEARRSGIEREDIAGHRGGLLCLFTRRSPGHAHDAAKPSSGSPACLHRAGQRNADARSAFRGNAGSRERLWIQARARVQSHRWRDESGQAR